MTDPLRVKFAGEIISAMPVQKLPNGNWLMSSCVKQRHLRFDVGHLIEITPAELIDPIPEITHAMDTQRSGRKDQESQDAKAQANVVAHRQ